MPHKGIRDLSSDEMTGLQYSQNGYITHKWLHTDVLGHYGGHGATYANQSYTEFLFGDACSYPHWANADGTLGSGTFGKIVSNGTYWDISCHANTNAQAGDVIDISGTTSYNIRAKVASKPNAATIRITNTNNYTDETSGYTGYVNSADGWREEDSTAGTKYYPDTKYIAMIKTMGTDTLGNLIECEVSASSLDGSDLVRPDISSSYNPDQSPASNYILMFHGDELYGQFNRIAVYRTSLSAMHGKAIFTKGPSLK